MHNIAVTVIIIAEGERAVRKEASRSKLESFFFLLLLLLIFIIFVVFIVVIPFGEPHRLPRLSFESLFRSGASTIFPFLVLGSDGRTGAHKKTESFFFPRFSSSSPYFRGSYVILEFLKKHHTTTRTTQRGRCFFPSIPAYSLATL